MTDIFLVSGLIFVAVMFTGGAVLIVRAHRLRLLQARLSGVHTSEHTTGAQVAHGNSWLVGLLQHIGLAYTPGEPSPSLREWLGRAGYYAPQTASVYMGVKIIMFLVGLSAIALMVVPLDVSIPIKIVAIGSGAGIFFFLPNFYVQQKLKKRTAEVRQFLPDATDLLDICVSTGMGLDTAWNTVAEEIRRVSSVLADEMALTNLEMHLGANRAVAMRHMALRTGAVELQSLVSILVQSQRFGTSVSEALRSFATMMREARSNRASEAAEKLAIKLIFPLVVFIFPAILIVAAGPAGIKIAQLFGGD